MRLDKARNYFYLDAFFTSFMIGAGESFFAAYILSQGLGEVVAGLVVGVPMMIGASLQTLTPYFFERFARPKRWVILASTVQALLLLVLVGTTFLPKIQALPLFLLIGFYWAAQYTASSVWNYWMGFVVPDDEKAHFFSFRTRLAQYGILIGLLLGGSLLQMGTELDWNLRSYALPFLLAFVGRSLAIGIMAKQSPVPNQKAKAELSLSPWLYVKESYSVFQKNLQARRDLTFLFVFNITIYLSSSFVAPFMIAQLRFNYLSFMATQMALYGGKIAALWLAKNWIEKFGLRRVLFWGSLGMSPLPALWILIEHTIPALFLQGISGFFWGLFEVAIGLVLFSELPARDKIQLLTWNSFFQTCAIVTGTMIGAHILSQPQDSLQGYFLLFVVGSACRTMWVLFQRPKVATNSK